MNTLPASLPRIFFCGDNHGHFQHIIDAVERERPDAIVLLGDIQAARPLEVELEPIIGKTIIRFLPGNHDTDRDFDYRNLYESKLAGCNLDGRVENVVGVRIGGLGGIFRSKVWAPPLPPAFTSYVAWLKANKPRHGEIDPARETEMRTHRSTIFPAVYEKLKKLKADVLATHEAPSMHPHGVEALDELARAMGVQTTFHGHHHDSLDYREHWEGAGFKSYGVGFCGITDLEGNVIRAGDSDDRGANR